MREPLRAVRYERHDVACPYCTHVFDALTSAGFMPTFNGVRVTGGLVECPECFEYFDYEVNP